MEQDPIKHIYVLDEKSAEKLMNLLYQQSSAILEFLEYRRFDLPTQHDVGFQEMEFHEECEDLKKL